MKMFSREPIPNTCPDIDEMISLLENLRDCNSKLREWGNKEAGRVDELENEVDDLKKAIDKLENYNEALQKDLDTAEDRISDLLTN